MSRVSGKCDFFDHLSFEKMVPKEGNPNVLVSDIMECFKILKRKTGGVIYQHEHLKVDLYNQKMIEELCDDFKVIEHKEEVKDLRKKSGVRTKTTYTYEYWGRTYNTLKELNKHGGVCVKVPIHFDNLVELLPYFPYLISASACNEDSETIFISKESFVEREFKDHLRYGLDSSSMRDHYRKELALLYRDVILTWFNPQGREIEEEVTFDETTLQGKLSKPVDDNFHLEWRFKGDERPSYWCSPKIVDAQKGIVEINKYDLQKFGNKMCVYYVEDKGFEPKYQ